MLLALLAGLLLIAICYREKQAAIVHRSSLQKPLMGGWTLTYIFQRPLNHGRPAYPSEA